MSGFVQLAATAPAADAKKMGKMKVCMMVGKGCSAQSHSIHAQVACFDLGLVEVVIATSLVALNEYFLWFWVTFHND